MVYILMAAAFRGLLLLLSAAERKALVEKVRQAAFLAPGQLGEQRVNIAVNGCQLTELRISEAGPLEYSVALPVELLRKENVLVFDLPDAKSPTAFHLGEDPRLLAINAQWFEIDSATSR